MQVHTKLGIINVCNSLYDHDHRTASNKVRVKVCACSLFCFVFFFTDHYHSSGQQEKNINLQKLPRSKSIIYVTQMLYQLFHARYKLAINLKETLKCASHQSL